jgi:hypothetical protein
MRQDPILLTGVYRSGTTILSCMLGAHPEINFTYGSVNYLRWFIKKDIPASNYRYIVLETKDRLLKRYGKIIDAENIIKSIESYEEKISHAHIYSSIMEDFFGDKAKRWGEKTLLEWTNIPTFLKLYTGSKAIHIVRDPRDVVSSFKGMTFEPGNRYLDAIFACLHSMDACTQYKKYLPKDRYYAVAYESLVTNPKDELAKISKFLGIEYSDSMMDRRMYKDQFGDILNIESHTSYRDTAQVPIGRWKEKLEPSDVAIIEGFLSQQLNAFNYNDVSKTGKSISDFLSIFQEEDLLMTRLARFLETGEGCEEYPSDPTKEENWTVLGEKNSGASSLYLRYRK